MRSCGVKTEKVKSAKLVNTWALLNEGSEIYNVWVRYIDTNSATEAALEAQICRISCE